MTTFRAQDLFVVRNVGPDSGMPIWADLRIRRSRCGTATAAAFAGPGLYGVFFDNYLIYIGLYAGTRTNPFGGSVLDRWSKHVVGLTLRARDLFFKPGPLHRIISELPGRPAADLASTLLNGINTTIAQMNPAPPPLKTRAIMSSFNKACFATQHWTVLNPRSNLPILDHFTFVYKQIRQPDGLRPDKPFVKGTWLKPCETILINKLRPICNSETDPAEARYDVCQAALRNEILNCFASLVPFAPAAQQSAMPASSPAASSPLATSEMADDQEDDGMSNGETRFRERLSAEGEMFVTEMIEDCPGGFNLFFTDKEAQLRVRLNVGNQRRLLIMKPSGNGFQCFTLASVQACRAIGLDAKRCPPGEKVMATQFWLDPAVHTPATLFAVLGAASQSLIPASGRRWFVA